MPRTRRHHKDQRQRHRHRHRHSTVTVLFTVAVALGTSAAACSDDPDLDPGPPAPAQITNAPSPPSSEGEPVITIDQAADVSDADPAVVAFRAYAAVLTDVLRSPDKGTQALDALTTGAAGEYLRSQVNGYATEGLHLFGTPEWIIVGIRDEGPEHRHVLSCENHGASYSVDVNDNPSDPLENRWEPDEHWFILSNGLWKLEELYRGNFSCEGFA